MRKDNLSELTRRLMRLDNFVQNESMSMQIRNWAYNVVVQCSNPAAALTEFNAFNVVPEEKGYAPKEPKKVKTLTLSWSGSATSSKAPRTDADTDANTIAASEPKRNKTTGARKTIPAVVRQRVWETFMGIDRARGACVCCKTSEISCFTFVCGHVMSDADGGEPVVDNLRPICATCNSSMGTSDMRDFCRKYFLRELE